jgi:hypothetical protein
MIYVYFIVTAINVILARAAWRWMKAAVAAEERTDECS